MKPYVMSLPIAMIDESNTKRRERGMTQPIYVLGCNMGAESAMFDVLGTSKTVYHVTYSPTEAPRCSCPDHIVRGNTCKHIYFLVDRVLGGNPSRSDWGAARKKITERLAHLQQDRNVFADEGSLNRYHELLAKNPQNAPGCRNDECAVCLTDFTPETLRDARVCPTCLNGVHKECWKKWTSVKSENCVYCRSKMGTGGEGKWGIQL